MNIDRRQELIPFSWFARIRAEDVRQTLRQRPRLKRTCFQNLHMGLISKFKT